MTKVERFNIQDHKIKCLVYGESGSWKTVFGSTASNPFWLSAEWGLASVMHTNPIGIKIESIKDLKDALIYVENNENEKSWFKIDTIIIDSITEINEIIKDDIKFKKWWRDLDWRDWWKIQDEIKAILRKFRNLDKHIIFTALAKESKDEDKIDKIVPMLNGQTARDIAAYMDLVCFMWINKTWEHYILTKWSQKYLTKDRFNQFPIDIEPNFSIFQWYIENLKLSKNEIVNDFKYTDDWIKKDLPNVNIEKITAKQIKNIITAWNTMWNLSIELYPNELDSKWNIRYTKEKNEIIRAATWKNIINTNTITEANKEQGLLFLEKLDEKILKLKNDKKVLELKKECINEEHSLEKEVKEKEVKDVQKKKPTKKPTKK